MFELYASHFQSVFAEHPNGFQFLCGSLLLLNAIACVIMVIGFAVDYQGKDTLAEKGKSARYSILSFLGLLSLYGAVLVGAVMGLYFLGKALKRAFIARGSIKRFFVLAFTRAPKENEIPRARVISND